MTRPRPGVVLIIAAALAIAIACGDYARTNPYDPNVPVTITITGPDTLFSYFDTPIYSASAVPAFDDSAFEWSSSDSFDLRPTAKATFNALNTPLYPATVSVIIGAHIGHLDTVITVNGSGSPVSEPTTTYRHSGYKTVVLTQLVTSILLRCPDTHACNPVPAGATWSVWVDGFDANNHKIVALTGASTNPTSGNAIATFAVRDTTIASVLPVGIRASTVTAKKTGSTWIVATRGALLDSLQLVVQ